MKKVTYLLGVLLFLSACSKNDFVELDDEFQINLGETVCFNSGDFKIRFDEVIRYSRCPDVECGWGGSDLVRLVITESSIDTNVDLVIFNSINHDSMGTAEYGNHLIKLIDVNPYPSESSIGVDYNVTIELTEL